MTAAEDPIHSRVRTRSSWNSVIVFYSKIYKAQWALQPSINHKSDFHASNPTSYNPILDLQTCEAALQTY